MIGAVEPQPLPGAVHAEAQFPDAPACSSVIMVAGEEVAVGEVAVGEVVAAMVMMMMMMMMMMR